MNRGGQEPLKYLNPNSMTNTERMMKMDSKCTVSLGWRDFVMSSEDALTLLGILSKAEMFQEVYKSETKTTAYYVYPQEKDDGGRVSIRLLPDELYCMARLAGRPIKEN